MAKAAFVFPGQGAQYVGMALSLSLPAAKALFDQAREILGYDLLEICVNGPAGEAQQHRHQSAGDLCREYDARTVADPGTGCGEGCRRIGRP
ncbi:MAG: hypothetical protein U0744_20345 [Gemmataceae bacterium]